MRAATTPVPAGVVEGFLRVAPSVERDGDSARIDASGVYFQQLNDAIRAEVAAGTRSIVIDGVNGQRYLGAGLKEPEVSITVNGTAGNDAAMFADGVALEVFGNAQDGVGNTMSSGRVVVHGDAGDVLGYGMRGGTVFVRGDVGYRVGIHMKAFEKNVPVMVCGGKARDFFGEYMAGGVLVLLGMNARSARQPLVGGFLGAGMHGGAIYLRGAVDDWQHGDEVGVSEADEGDMALLGPILKDYCDAMGMDVARVLAEPFTKVAPLSHRPYAKLYASL